MTHLIIDIETTSGTDEWVIERAHERVKPPGNISKAETIEKWWAEHGEAAKAEAVEGTALNGTYGQISVIGAMFPNDVKPRIYSAALDGGEYGALQDFHMALSMALDDQRTAGTMTWSGWNIAGFDLRYLWQRAHANGLPRLANAIPHNETPWSSRILDLMFLWCGNDRRQWVRKEDCALALGLAVPSDAISGKEAPGLWAAGEYAKVERHCAQDVELTAQILQRLTQR